MSVDTVGRYCSHRLFEWTTALAMSAFGLHVLLVPGALTSSRYAAVLLFLSAAQFALACVIVGFVRIVALTMNGQWPGWGPRLRALAALCAAAIWAQLAVALTQSGPSPGMWVYYALMAAELRSVLRARRDGDGTGHH